MPVSATSQPRAPDQQVLFQVVRDHFETFRAEAATIRDGEGLPRFVEEEFRAFLRCGCLAAGFARLRWGTCGRERLLPFSCKGRGFCASCGGRRMTERAAHLVDRVLPAVPIRQWVLTVPVRLRYVLAWDHDLCRAVIGVAMRTIAGYLRHLAREAGVVDPRGGVDVRSDGLAARARDKAHAVEHTAKRGDNLPERNAAPRAVAGGANLPWHAGRLVGKVSASVSRALKHGSQLHPAHGLQFANRQGLRVLHPLDCKRPRVAAGDEVGTRRRQVVADEQIRFGRDQRRRQRRTPRLDRRRRVNDQVVRVLPRDVFGKRPRLRPDQARERTET